MYGLPLAFMIISLLLFVIFVLLSYTIIGFWLSEIGLLLSWIPIGMITIAIILSFHHYLAQEYFWHFFMMIVSVLFNLITLLRLFIPFSKIHKTNRILHENMKQALGEDYLSYVDPFINSQYFRSVKFKLFHYLIGVRQNLLNKRVNTINNVLYRTFEDENENLTLNIYYPKRRGVFPTIVFIHGGGFVIGSKDQQRNIRLCKTLANYGFTIFSVDYRLAPLKMLVKKGDGDAYPMVCDMVSDIREAIIFAKKNTAKYSGNINDLFLFGRSAGGHLALLTSFSCMGKVFGIKEEDGSIIECGITGVIAFYPVTDFTSLYEFYGHQNIVQHALARGVGGTPNEKESLYRLFSPIDYVKKDNVHTIPPVFLVTGRRDRLVAPQQSETLFKKLQEFNITSVLIEFPWANHSFDVVLNGPAGQLAIKYMTQFLVWVMTHKRLKQISDLAESRGLGNIVSKEKVSIVEKMKDQNPNEEVNLNYYLPFIEYNYADEEQVKKQ